MHLFNPKFLFALIRNRHSRHLNRQMIDFEMRAAPPPFGSEDVIRFCLAVQDDPTPYVHNKMIPPFFFVKLALPALEKLLCHPGLGLNFLRMVHATQSIRWYRLVKFDDNLHISLKIVGISDTPAGDMLEISSRLYANDCLAIEGISGLIVRGKRRKTQSKKPLVPEPPAHFRLRLKTDAGQQMQYAKASGDHNFIHTSNFLAKRVGLPGTIMHGACVLCMTCGALLKERADANPERLVGIKGRFSGITMPGDPLTIIGYESPNGSSVNFKVFNGAQEPVFTNGSFEYRE